MKTSGALLVLLCCCLAETQIRGKPIGENDITHQDHYGEAETRENEVMGAAQRTEAAATVSTQQTCQPDIHTVLREMTALMVEQRVELRYTKTQIQAMETRLIERLAASENKAETMETRLRASEKTVEEQRAVIKELKEKQEEQGAAVRAVGGSVNLTGSQVQELRSERKERRVSFSASLVASGAGTTGPFNIAIPLVYKHIFTNIGNAYNPNTGVFTAPVRGVYHFYFALHGHGHASFPSVISLHKNGELVVTAWCQQAGYSVNPSNGASLLLEVGDVVNLILKENARVWDNLSYPHTTFSGHLLFTV
ncbi:complement C1q-like protein 2 [Clupea harengus]|uniref:Complement C1q-like protein 2 n=1 Tax=Clupea harengus TaxID=7950 RepID=A0A8M1KNA5_CLUHA|nr:complement C1q-like protein 2 [Clupea harengus]